MKKTILVIATIITLATGNSFAQRYKGYDKPIITSPRRDNAVEEFQINKLDKIVGLTRKQENKIKKIENKYDRMTSGRRPHTYQAAQRLEVQKQQEILSVLTPVQRQRLFAYQQNNRGYNRRG